MVVILGSYDLLENMKVGSHDLRTVKARSCDSAMPGAMICLLMTTVETSHDPEGWGPQLTIQYHLYHCYCPGVGAV